MSSAPQTEAAILRESISDNLSAWWRFWLLALFSIPFIQPYRWLPNLSFYQDVAAYLFAAAAMAAVAWTLEGRTQRHALRVSAVALVPLLLVGCLIVQQLMGKIEYLQHFLLPAGALILAAGAITTSHLKLRAAAADAMLYISVGIVGAAVLNALWTIVQVAGFELRGFELIVREPGPFRVSGLVAQPNQLAVLLVWALFGLFHLQTKRAIGWPLALLLAGFFMAVLVLAGSRSTYVYLLACGPLFSVLLRRLRHDRWWLPALAAGAYFVLEGLVRLVMALLMVESEAIRALGGTSGASRVLMAQDGLKLFLESPVLGVGWHQYIAARSGMEDAHLVWMNADHSHNIIVNLLAETGLVGFGVVIVGLLLWLKRVSRVDLTLERALMLVLLAVIGLYSLLEFPLWQGHFLIPCAVLVGLLEPKLLVARVSRGMGALIAGSSIALLIAVAALPFDYARVESKYRFYFGSATSASGPSLEELLSLTNHTLYRKEAEQIYIAVAPIDSLQATLNEEMGRRVYEAMPHSTFAIVRAGHLVYLDQPDAAATILKRTCKWWPPSCVEIRTRFIGLAEEKGEPFSSFVKGHLDKVLTDSAKLKP